MDRNNQRSVSLCVIDWGDFPCLVRRDGLRREYQEQEQLGGNSRRPTMLGRYRGIFAALTALILLCGSEQPDKGRQTNRLASSPTQQISGITSADGKPLPPPTPTTSLDQCVSGPTYYDCEDLKAQQSMARWTQYMGVAAIAGVFLSFIGIGLVYTTFDETRKGNKIAQRAVEAAEREAKAAKEALVLAERAIVRIGLGTIATPSESDRTWPLSLAIENDGRSNAHRFRVDYVVSDKPIWTWNLPEFRNIDILCRPEGSAVLEIRIRAPKQFPAYVLGFVTYHTVHDAIFKAFFCRQITGFPTEDGYGEIEHRRAFSWRCEGIPRDN